MIQLKSPSIHLKSKFFLSHNQQLKLVHRRFLQKPESLNIFSIISINSKNIPTNISFEIIWICNRGIPVEVGNETLCLCPPSYYGSRCQYQNQRVSLTVQFRQEVGFVWNAVFTIVFTLIDHDEHRIQSFDQIIYLPTRDCSAKLNIYLLYSKRPNTKAEESTNYSVRIDAYNSRDLSHHATWYLDIPLQFLPVNRISTQLNMPARAARTFLAPSFCVHGQQMEIENGNKITLCLCDSGWSGRRCDIEQRCDCSTESRCVGKVANNRSICVCPLEKFGRCCRLRISSCTENTCKNGGACVPSDQRISMKNFTCICNEGYFGMRCEYMKRKVEIWFTDGLIIPAAIIAHVISAPDKSAAPLRITLFSRSKIDQDSISLFINFEYHMIFVEIDSISYLAVLQEEGVTSNMISTSINPSRRCPSVNEFFNSTVLAYHILRRVKYYHSVCQMDWPCFHDEIYMCLCTIERHANCFKFDHHKTHICRTADKYCQHDGARCFEDHPVCPTSLLCVCPDCTFGAKCQFSTTGFGFSLDAIIGYHIRPHTNFTEQNLAVKTSMALTMSFFFLGLINGFLSIATFKSVIIQQTGSGFYLLCSARTSVLIIIVLLMKFWFLFVSQAGSLTNRSFLLFNCHTMDFLLNTLLNTSDWLNACVSIERAVTVSKGAVFNKMKSKRMFQRIVVLVLLMTIASNMPDPIYRRLIDDGEEVERIWCVVSYSKKLELFVWLISIFHFLTPFVINLLIAFYIINRMARQRSTVHANQTYWQQLQDQFGQLKNLLISPCILIILAVPRLLISFLAGCMKTIREPWLFLVGYFVSFVPSLMTFIVFVLLSTVYRKEFDQRVMQKIITSFRQTFLRHSRT